MPNTVTLSGEGGKLAGRKDYWKSILQRLKEHKHLPISVISIGGGVGDDALAIAQVLEEEGFKVQKPIIVDPNHLAAFLSEEKKLDYYITTSQRFFSTLFSKEGGILYFIHLGTTLNVVKEEDVVQILDQIAKIMHPNDALSLIMVAKKQFSGGTKLSFGSENEQGISRVINLNTGKHYKTVITDSKKFLKFMISLGLSGEIVETVERNETLTVAFIAYKALKVPTKEM